jgi:hypothetical protein
VHWAVGALVSTAAWVAATVVAKPVADPDDESPPVVLVVLDGVRWQEVFDGVDSALAMGREGPSGSDAAELLPNVYAATRSRGALLGAPGHGKTIVASGPNFVSMPGYTEIFEGRPPVSCQDNECAGAREPTLADEIRARATRDSDVAVFASWERIRVAATRDPSHIVLSAGRTDVGGGDVLGTDPEMNDALERGRYADAYPGHGAFRPDRFTGALALRYLDAKRPAFLFVGLGEPDEYAHRGDYAGYLASLRAADDFIGQLLATLDRMGERGRRTLVVLTSDHGRARDYREHGAQFPESARVWLAAFGGPVHARGFAEAPQPRRLADIAPTIRTVLAIKPDRDPSGGTPLSELFEDIDHSGVGAVSYAAPP